MDWQPIQTKNTICGREEVESCLFDCNSNLPEEKFVLFYFFFILMLLIRSPGS